MADVNFKPAPPPAPQDTDSPPASPDRTGDCTALPHDLIELLFFAYKDFTGDPDDVLAGFEFGRAHHRVLHFVSRNPGIMVTDLLAILRITKQSLGRVLKQLVDEGMIEQHAGLNDRRQRLLYTTDRGFELAESLIRLQQKRLERALIGLPDGSEEIVRQFLLQMIDPDARADILKLVRSPFPLKD